MRAVYYNDFGPAEVLTIGDMPVPRPGPGEVLLQVAATSVNPIDRRLRAGELQPYFQRKFPIVPGWDVAGRIVELGDGVSGWRPGQAVAGLAFAWFLQHGTYAEYVPIAASAIAAMPPGLSFAQAAALPTVALTAWQAIVEEAKLRQGQSILIQAGAGGVGSVAISIARHLGAVVYTTARRANFDYVRARGAATPIDYSEQDYVALLRGAEPQGLDAIIESTESARAVEAAIRLVRDGGTVVYMNNPPPETDEIARRNIHTLFIHNRPDGALLGKLMAMFADGTLMLPEIELLPLESAIDAHRRSESGRTRGKLVLEVANI